MPYKDPVRQRQVQHEWYLQNKERLLKRQKELRQEYRKVIWAEKIRRGCAKCGYNTSPYPLDAHHKDNNKEFEISDAIRARKSLEEILVELAKCDILCANCHRIEHAELRLD